MQLKFLKRLIMKIPSKSKYQVKIMDIYVDGSIIGQMVRNRTAQQAWEEMIEMAELRKAWYDTIESNKEVVWKTPIIGD